MSALIRKKIGKLLVISLLGLFLLGGFTLVHVMPPINWGVLFYSGGSSPALSKGVKIENITENMLIHAIKKGVCWASRGNTIYVSLDNGKSWNKKSTLPYSMINKQYLQDFFIIRKIFDKKGIDKIKVLNSGTILIFDGPYLWRSTDGGNSFEVAHEAKNPPLPQGWTEGNGAIFYGEYVWPNKERREVNLWKSIDDGKSWFIVYTFQAGSVRHIHAVQYDSYADRIWVTTGDDDPEPKIMYTINGGKTFEIIGQGSQEWRTVSLLFTEDFIYWGMDAPSEQNHIFRWDRKTCKRKAVAKIDGPAYYSTKLENASLLLTTAVEGEVGEWDKSAHIWLRGINDENWVDLASWKKISGARNHGLLRLAHPNESSCIYVTPLDTEGHYSIFQIKIGESYP